MQDTTDNLFEITLQPEGARYLVKVYRLTVWILIGAVLVSLSTMGFLLVQQMAYLKSGAAPRGVFMSVYLLCSAAITVLSIVQISFYFYFTRQCKISIETRQTELFNQSLKWLYRNSVMTFIEVVVHIISIVCYLLFIFSKYPY